jgi:hypothetical protein
VLGLFVRAVKSLSAGEERGREDRKNAPQVRQRTLRPRYDTGRDLKQQHRRRVVRQLNPRTGDTDLRRVGRGGRAGTGLGPNAFDREALDEVGEDLEGGEESFAFEVAALEGIVSKRRRKRGKGEQDMRVELIDPARSDRINRRKGLLHIIVVEVRGRDLSTRTVWRKKVRRQCREESSVSPSLLSRRRNRFRLERNRRGAREEVLHHQHARREERMNEERLVDLEDLHPSLTDERPVAVRDGEEDDSGELGFDVLSEVDRERAEGDLLTFDFDDGEVSNVLREVRRLDETAHSAEGEEEVVEDLGHVEAGGERGAVVEATDCALDHVVVLEVGEGVRESGDERLPDNAEHGLVEGAGRILGVRTCEEGRVSLNKKRSEKEGTNRFASPDSKALSTHARTRPGSGAPPEG